MVNISFSEEINNFQQSMNGHISVITSCMPLLEKRIKKLNKEFNDIFSKAKEIKKEEKTCHTCSIENRTRCHEIRKIGDPTFTALKMLPKNIFCSMYNTFENHISNLYKISLVTFPSSVDASNQKYSYLDVVNIGSIEKLKNDVVENEVLSFTHQPLFKQIEFLEKKHKVSLIERNDEYLDLIKLSIQRNLFTHNSGIINPLYLEKCKEYNCKVADEEKVGDSLHFCTGCFFYAYEIIVLAGLKIGQNLWRKIFKEDIDSADSVLIRTGFDFLDTGRYKLAIRFLKYSCRLKTLKDEFTKKLLTINSALAFYLSEDKETSGKIISEYDWSDISLKFEIALSTLNEDYEKVRDLIIKMGKDGEISPDDYYQWPLFKKFRETEFFTQAMDTIGLDPSYCHILYDIPSEKKTLSHHNNGNDIK